MTIRYSRALNGAALLLLMFALGITLVTLFKGHPPPPQAQQQEASPPLPPQRPEPKTPSEVVAAYWTLSFEGDIDGANRYWSAGITVGDFQKLNAVRSDWAVIIREKKWRLVKIEKEVAEGDDTVYVIASVTSDRGPFIPSVKNELVKVKGEWKVVAIYSNHDY